MNIEELRDAIEYLMLPDHQSLGADVLPYIECVVEAARLVADPNIDEAEETLEKLADLGIGIGFRQAARLVVAAALAPGDTE